jgi:hypothetical protein
MTQETCAGSPTPALFLKVIKFFPSLDGADSGGDRPNTLTNLDERGEALGVMWGLADFPPHFLKTLCRSFMLSNQRRDRGFKNRFLALA